MTLSTKELIEAMKDIVITDEMEQKLRDRLEKSRLEMAEHEKRSGCREVLNRTYHL